MKSKRCKMNWQLCSFGSRGMARLHTIRAEIIDVAGESVLK